MRLVILQSSEHQIEAPSQQKGWDEAKAICAKEHQDIYLIANNFAEFFHRLRR